MDWIRIFIGVALFFCGLILSLLGIIAGKRANGEPVDWLRLGKSVGLTFGGAIPIAAFWPLDEWNWVPWDAVKVLAFGFGINTGLTQALKILFPKQTV